jgi:hypothetical protein
MRTEGRNWDWGPDYPNAEGRGIVSKIPIVDSSCQAGPIHSAFGSHLAIFSSFVELNYLGLEILLQVSIQHKSHLHCISRTELARSEPVHLAFTSCSDCLPDDFVS